MTESLITDQNDHVQIEEGVDYYEQLVGEGKKFKDNEALARGKFEADQFIALQNKRMDELRADYLRLREEHQASASLKELVDQLATPKRNDEDRDSPKADDSDNRPAFDPNQLESLFEKKIREHEVRSVEQRNFNEVRNKLKEMWGDKSSSLLKKQIDDLGLTVDDVNSLARKSPKAFFKTLGLDQQNNNNGFEAPPRSNQRNDNFAPGTKQRTWSYYQEIKKSDPKLYWDPKTQIQMQKDAIALGESFQDGGWNTI